MGKIKLKVCQQTQATTPSRPLLAEVLTCLHYSLDAVVLMTRRPLEALGFSSHTTTLEMAQNTNKNLVPNFYNSFLVYFLHSNSIYSNQKEFIQLFQWCLKPFSVSISDNNKSHRTTNNKPWSVCCCCVVGGYCSVFNSATAILDSGNVALWGEAKAALLPALWLLCTYSHLTELPHGTDLRESTHPNSPAHMTTRSGHLQRR